MTVEPIARREIPILLSALASVAVVVAIGRMSAVKSSPVHASNGGAVLGAGSSSSADEDSVAVLEPSEDPLVALLAKNEFWSRVASSAIAGLVVTWVLVWLGGTVRIAATGGPGAPVEWQGAVVWAIVAGFMGPMIGICLWGVLCVAVMGTRRNRTAVVAASLLLGILILVAVGALVFGVIYVRILTGISE